MELRCTITILRSPLHYEDALVDALNAAKNPPALVSGTSQLRNGRDTDLEIELDVTRPKEALETIARVLHAAGVPAESTIELGPRFRDVGERDEADDGEGDEEDEAEDEDEDEANDETHFLAEFDGEYHENVLKTTVGTAWKRLVKPARKR